MTQQPESYFNFEPANGAPRKIFMSFGLLSRLASFVGEDKHLPQLFSDIDLQNVIIGEMLAKRDAEGLIVLKADPMSLEANCTIEEGHRLMEWVSEHLSDFFVKRLHATLKMQERMKATMKV